MSTSVEPCAPPSSHMDERFGADLDRLWAEMPRLSKIGLGGEIVSRLSDHAGALRFLLHASPDRPLLAGLVGGASCGKSTLFDSLVGSKLSQIHYRPHSSLGPILSLARRHRARLFPEAPPRRFFPDLTADCVNDNAGPISGSVGSVAVALHDDDRWRHLVLMDLPDISSESARREGWLVRHLLPWLDLVVWMVDPNDYLFEDLYIDLIEQVAVLGQRSIVVVNDIHGQVDADNSVLQERVARFRPDAWFLLPRLECTTRDPYPVFRNELAFQKLKEFLLGHRIQRPVAPLMTRVRHEIAVVMHANSEWVRLVRELSTSLARLVARYRKSILASAPLLSVLPETAQQELVRLRNRFSLWHQGKRLYQAVRSPARAVGRAMAHQINLAPEDLNTDSLFRHLVGALKEFGVELHRGYLESRLVERLQRQDAAYDVLGSFDPESLNFQTQLDAVARHLFTGAQQMLSDPSLLKDKRFQFVAGTTGVILTFLVVETLLGIPGVTLVLGKGVTALVGVLSPELARYLPLDRMSRLAREAREMLAAILDEQIRKMVEFYTEAEGRYLEPDDPLIPILEALSSEAQPLGDLRS